MSMGPLPSASARAWIANTRRIVRAVRDHPDLVPFTVPAEVLDLFDSFLDQWERAAQQETFRWRGDDDAAKVRRLVTYWLTLDSLTDDDLEALGCSWAPPEAAPFYAEVTRSVVEALAEADESESFADQLARLWPAEGEFSRPGRPGRPSGSPRADGDEPGALEPTA